MKNPGLHFALISLCALSLSACSEARKNDGNEPQGGDPATASDGAAAGDVVSGDASVGDSGTGDPGIGDSSPGDLVPGDSSPGDSGTGDPVAGDPSPGDGAGDAGPGDASTCGDGFSGPAELGGDPASWAIAPSGDTTPPGATALSLPVAQENVMDILADVICESIQRCAPVVGQAHPSIEDCKRYYFEAPGYTWFDYNNPSLYEFNATQFETCALEILNRDCSEDHDFAWRTSCQQALVGLSTLGTCCDHRGGCEPGTACVGATHANTGTCEVLPGIDAPCAPEGCVDGAYCNKWTNNCETVKGLDAPCEGWEGECGPYQCANGVCAPPQRIGHDCKTHHVDEETGEPGGEEMFFRNQRECGTYSHCFRPTNTCVSLNPQGGTCGLNGHLCATIQGLICDALRCNICIPAPREGEECFFGGGNICIDRSEYSCSSSVSGFLPECHRFLDVPELEAEPYNCYSFSDALKEYTWGPCKKGLYCDDASGDCKPLAQCE